MEEKKPVKIFLKKANKNKLFAKWLETNLKKSLKNTKYSKKIKFGKFEIIPTYIDY